MNKISNNIKEARIGMHLSQNGLAAITKIPASIISLYENDKRKPSIDNLKKLCCALNVSADHLLGLEQYRLNVDSAKIREIEKILNW